MKVSLAIVLLRDELCVCVCVCALQQLAFLFSSVLHALFPYQKLEK